MSFADLMADNFVDLFRRKSDFGQERPPGIQAQIDSVFQDADRIGLHELCKCV